MCQDNNIIMMLAKNGKYSSRKRTNNINVNFFEDRLARKDISMEYFTTADMYGNFYTNLTQGRLYKTQRQAIMNLQSNYPNYYVPDGYESSGSKECVSNNHPNRNEVAATQTGEIKCVRRYRNVLIYAQAVIAGHRGGMSDVWYKRQRSD